MDKAFFPKLLAYMISGPVVCMAWEGKDVVAMGRKMLGATNPLESAPGTIRGDYSLEVGLDVVVVVELSWVGLLRHRRSHKTPHFMEQFSTARLSAADAVCVLCMYPVTVNVNIGTLVGLEISSFCKYRPVEGRGVFSKEALLRFRLWWVGVSNAGR